MKNQKERFQNEAQCADYDPDPLSIAFTIIGAVLPIGVLIAERAFTIYDDQAKRKEAVRNQLYETYRVLIEAEKVLKNFASYIDQQGNLDKQFGLGYAPLVGDLIFLSKIDVLYKDSWETGRKLNETVVALAKLLEKDDFQVCVRYSGELRNLLQRTIQARNYRDYIVGLGRFITQAKRLIQGLGERYGFQQFESLF